jgi:uncharacterized membrane protein YqjE
MDESPLENVQQQLNRLTGDVHALVRARMELARVEGQAAWMTAQRMMVGTVLALVLVLVSLPLFLVALGQGLSRALGGNAIAWWVALGLLCVSLAAILAYRVWKRFQQEFAGFEQSLEELQADAAWWRALVEAAGRPDEIPRA